MLFCEIKPSSLTLQVVTDYSITCYNMTIIYLLYLILGSR